MGLLHEAATRIVTHCRARTAGDSPIQDVVARERARQQTAVDAVCNKLVEGHAVQPEDAVRVIAPLESYQCAEGTMRWEEQWICPSTDLLMYLDGIYPYGQPGADSPFLWEMAILVLFKAAGHWLPVEIAPLLPAWTQPRGQSLWLTPIAKQVGLQPRKWEQKYLQPSREPHPDLGQRVWRIPVDVETTSAEEVLTHLVVVALKQEFPVAMEDQQRALEWVKRIAEEEIRRRSRGDSEQMGKEVGGEVFQVLLNGNKRSKRSQSDGFDLPATPWALQDFIKKTAWGRVRDEWKKRPADTPHHDDGTGETIYPDAWIAQEFAVSPRTVARWKYDRGIITRGFSEVQYADFSKVYGPKMELKRLREQARKAGRSPHAAAEDVKKLSQRKLTSDGRPDFEAINAHIARRRKKAEACSSLKDRRTVLKNHIAELQDRLNEATTRDEWETIQEELEKARGYLQQLQEGSDT